jgi:hypothetical protein
MMDGENGLQEAALAAAAAEAEGEGFAKGRFSVAAGG